MHILIVTQYFWPESFRINDLAHGLRDRGHQMTVLTGLPNYPDGKLFSGYSMFSRGEDYGGVTVKRVPLITRGTSKARLVANYLSFAALASLLGPYRCRQHYDAILVYEPSPVTVGVPAVVMKWFRRAPILFWVQDLWPESLSATGTVTSPTFLKNVDRLVRNIYRHCDHVLIQSEGFAPHVRAQGVAEDRIHYFPNWAEGFYRPVELDADAPERGELPEGFRILFAGNLGASQSLDTILDAAEATCDEPHIQWLIMGDGRDKPRIETAVRERKLADTVHLLGRRPAESMPRYFAAADALLVTLKSDPIFSLTIPSKVQCYLACGRPILAALDGEGARVIDQAGAGLVGPAEDARILAQNARRLRAATEQERSTMGTAGRRFSEQWFDRSRLLDRLESLIAGATNLRRQAA